MLRIIDTLLTEMSLEEMPIPSEWDAKIFDAHVPFAKRVKYAKERAQQIGKGSSRVAFKIPYEGRDTVLKIAMNQKGIAQNEHEVQFFFHDQYLDNLELTIPGIDYDERNEEPTWIHTEFGRKATLKDFKKACGGSPVQLMQYAFFESGQRHAMYGGYSPTTYKDIDPESELAKNFTEFVGNYDMKQIGIQDLQSIRNWAIYMDPKTHTERPVIIDLGLSSDIWKTYYS